MAVRSLVLVLSILVAFAVPVSAEDEPRDEQCRIFGLYLFDPSVPMMGWVDFDPDGCFQRVIYRVLTTIDGVTGPVVDSVKDAVEEICSTCPGA